MRFLKIILILAFIALILLSLFDLIDFVTALENGRIKFDVVTSKAHYIGKYAILYFKINGTNFSMHSIRCTISLRALNVKNATSFILGPSTSKIVVLTLRVPISHRALCINSTIALITDNLFKFTISKINRVETP